MTRYILGIDQGGSGSRASIYDGQGRVCGYGYRKLGWIKPQLGWVEQSPQAVADSVREAIGEAIERAAISARDIVACGITSQRDTVFAWDTLSGDAIGNAITWQDLRTQPLVAETDGWALAHERRARLGQFPGAYSSAMHMAWRMRHDAAFRRAADEERLRVSLAAGWLVAALGRPAEHALDYSLLQGMTVFDVRKRRLWDEWLAYLNIPRAALPVARPTNHYFGDLLLPDGDDIVAVPVLAMITDQQAALFGYDCRLPGQAAATHGTASFVNVVAGSLAPPQGVCKVYLAWELAQTPAYALEADLTVTGAAARWMQEFGLVASTDELSALAERADDSAGVVFVPAFTGLGVPSEDRSVRGSILGLTLGSTRQQLARAFFEAIGCQLRDIVEQMEREAGVVIAELRVGGGMAGSDVACQIQSDVLGLPLIRAQDTETSVRAAALLAGIGAQIWPDATALPSLLDENVTRFEPQLASSRREALLNQWREAVRRLRG
jgi:glycerol kinase